MVGLIESYARQLGIAPNPALTSWQPGDNVLSADEAMQIVRARPPTTSTSRPPTPSTRPTTSARRTATRSSTPCATRPRRAGTRTFGYGRVNAYEMLKARARRAHPARGHDRRAGLVRRAAHHGHGRRHRARGRAAGSTPTTTGSSGRPASQPPLYPATDHWTVAGSGTGLDRARRRGRWPPSTWPRSRPRLPDRRATAPPSTRRTRTAPTRRSSRCASASSSPPHGGDGRRIRRARCRSRCSSTTTPISSPGSPMKIAGVSTSSPRFVDLLGDGHQELLLATADGEIHAYRSDMSELPGLPPPG